MPEGPEVRRAADEIQDRLGGHTLERVVFDIKRLAPRASELEGKKIESLDTFGKATVTNIEGGLHIYSHNMLYGKWILVRAGEPTGTKKTPKMELHTSEYSLLLYSTNSIDLLHTEDLPEHKYLSKLGPDVLSDDLTKEDVAELLSSTWANKQIGVTLLDQAFLAGVGNYLRSEILIRAKLHHTRTPATMTSDEIDTLAEQILRVSRESYDAGGATAGNYLTLPKGESANFDNFEFAAYKQEGKPCPQCGTLIELVEFQSRNVFYCPSCQKAK
jgi:endonuclease-8